MTTHVVGRAGEPDEIVAHRFMLAPERELEVRIVRLGGAPERPFIDHEIAAARLDGRLEALDRLLDPHEIVGTMVIAERDPAGGKPSRDLARHTSQLFILAGVRVASPFHG